MYNSSGTLIGVLGIGHDITERKQIEVALKESNEQLNVILENNPIAIWDWDIKTDKWFATQKYYTLLGYEPESNYPDRTVWLNRIHPDDRESVRNKISNILNHTDNQYSYEARMLHADGSYRWQTVLGKAIDQDEDGNVSHMIGVRIDTNERKQAEEDIRILNNELEQRVIERTSQLEAANKELEAFSYSVSHDLRAPLRHINGYISLLNERYRDELPEKALHYLEIVTSAAKQMGILIDDLLQFSRTGRQEVHQTKTDMNILIKEVLELLKPDIENRKINWSVQELPIVFSDYSLLKQVWLNLLDNAVKYTRNEKLAEISIGCTENQENVVFFVRDNGVGFDMKYANKLFGVFQRLHSQSEFEGTGIGLANVQRIIHKHNGQVWFKAQPGTGATFFFSLPKNKEV
jgi:PAS domain S-box-containing protein